MAIIEYSALVNRIKGRISHSILSNWKGKGVVKRHNSGVHQPRTERQQLIRGMLNDLAGEFYALSAVQKELWGGWIAMYKFPMTALNAFVSFNMKLQKYTPGVARLQSPPPSPATPEAPVGVSVTAISGLDFCVAFTAPTTADPIVLCDLWAMPGRDSTVNPRWRFGGSADGDGSPYTVVGDYPADTILCFRVRTMDAFGRVSPWSHTLRATTIA